MIKIYATGLLLLSCSLFASAQKIKMEIIMGSKTIGEINAEKITKDKSVQYEMNSHVKASMVVTVTVNLSTKSYWYDGVLILSRAIRNSNMPGQKQNTLVEQKGQEYMVTNNSVVSSQTYPVRVTTTTLYFIEPVNDTTIFSEIQGKYLPIANLGNHQYLLTQPNGKKDKYIYQNGNLLKIETVIAGKNVVFLVK